MAMVPPKLRTADSRYKFTAATLASAQAVEASMMALDVLVMKLFFSAQSPIARISGLSVLIYSFTLMNPVSLSFIPDFSARAVLGR